MREISLREGRDSGPFYHGSGPACGFLVAGRGEKGKGSLSVRTQNQKRGGRLGGLEQAVETSWGPWWGAARQAQVRENLDDHRGIFDRRNER